ncbi:hypothetical protein C8R44DRAFT_871813 [Mycena epipterygia]|nr:hypothetical protein C8R44DRAFT_871813 [Mycena epipterygia]
MSVRKSTRKAASKINSSIATIAAGDLIASDEEEFPETVLPNSDPDLTLIDQAGSSTDPDEDEDDEEQLNDADDEEEGSNDENEGSEDDDEDQNVIPMSYATHEDDEDSDDEECDNDDNDDNLPVKSKSKKRARRSSSMESAAQKKTRGPAKKTEPESRKITYIIAIFATAAAKNDQVFDTLKAQILARISESLKPGQLHYEDYNISFTVPRQVTDSLSLDSPEKYQHLVLNALKIKADPSARISVVPKPGRVIINNENAEVNSDEDDPKKKTKGKRRKTTIPNARQILPGNVALNEKMGLIRARWLCPTPGSLCGSEHCYVQPDAVEHFPLSHTHVECWAAAWLKDKNFANENKPPNHKLFDGLNDKSLGTRSPSCNMNFNFLPELVQLFRQPAPAPAPTPAPAPAAVPFHAHVPMLIPAPFVPGPNLSIEDFCAKHDLDDDICARFKSNKFN